MLIILQHNAKYFLEWLHGTIYFMKKCGVEDCEREYRSMGYCNMHRVRFLRHGNPGTASPIHYVHGNTSASGKNHYLYRTWTNMRNRCSDPKNPAYKNYGGRGIRVCERWDNFANFIEDMGERPEGLTLDRVNNDGNYEPSNCRWATRTEQNNNQRPRKKRA